MCRRLYRLAMTCTYIFFRVVVMLKVVLNSACAFLCAHAANTECDMKPKTQNRLIMSNIIIPSGTVRKYIMWCMLFFVVLCCCY